MEIGNTVSFFASICKKDASSVFDIDILRLKYLSHCAMKGVNSRNEGLKYLCKAYIVCNLCFLEKL